MFCINCGNKIAENNKFCTNCGQPIDNTENGTLVNDKNSIINKDNSAMSEQDKKKANLLCILSLIFTYAPGMILAMASQLTDDIDSLSEIGSIPVLLCSLAGLVLMIVARVKYPKSTFAKVLMWIYIILIVANVIGIMLLMIMCSSIARSC